MPPKYTVPTETYALQSGSETISLELRGLSAMHVTALIRAQGEIIEGLYEKVQDGSELAAADTEGLVLHILDEAPLIVGLIISFGIGEDDLWEDALVLPLSEQVAIIDRIIALTFAREGGAKKVWGIIQKAMQAMVAPLREAIQRGSAD